MVFPRPVAVEQPGGDVAVADRFVVGVEIDQLDSGVRPRRRTGGAPDSLLHVPAADHQSFAVIGELPAGDGAGAVEDEGLARRREKAGFDAGAAVTAQTEAVPVFAAFSDKPVIDAEHAGKRTVAFQIPAGHVKSDLQVGDPEFAGPAVIAETETEPAVLQRNRAADPVACRRLAGIEQVEVRLFFVSGEKPQLNRCGAPRRACGFDIGGFGVEFDSDRAARQAGNQRQRGERTGAEFQCVPRNLRSGAPQRFDHGFPGRPGEIDVQRHLFDRNRGRQAAESRHENQDFFHRFTIPVSYLRVRHSQFCVVYWAGASKLSWSISLIPTEATWPSA